MPKSSDNIFLKNTNCSFIYIYIYIYPNVDYTTVKILNISRNMDVKDERGHYIFKKLIKIKRSIISSRKIKFNGYTSLGYIVKAIHERLKLKQGQST